MHQDPPGDGLAPACRQDKPLLALLAAAALLVACDTTPPGEEGPSGSTAAQEDQPAEQPSAGGKPVQYPPDGKPQEPPTPPEGIDSVPVPAEVREGQASYQGDDTPGSPEIRSFEVPISLGAGPGESSLGRRLLDEGLPPETPGDDVVFVSAASRRAHGPGIDLEVTDGEVTFEPGDGESPGDARLSNILATGTSEVDRVTAAYDPHAGRFLLLALERPSGASSTHGSTPPRIVLAVSDDSDPRGGWHALRIAPEELSEGDERLQDLQGLAVDEHVVCVVVTAAVEGTSDPRTRVYSIAKGLATSGFFTGGTANIRAY